MTAVVTDLLDNYEVSMRGAGLSERWIRDSLSTLRKVERETGTNIAHMATVELSRFLGRPHLSANSRSTYFGQLVSFYRWLADNGGANPMERMRRPRVPRSVPRPVSDAQLNRLLAQRMHHRTRVMILLAAFAGLRVHEIAKFRGEDIDPIERVIRVQGKGGHRAELPAHPLLVDAAGSMPRSGWWFPSNSKCPGEHVLSRSVSDIIGRTMRRADVPGTPHSLRHWYGTTLVRSGADLRTARTLLRHASLATTQIYTAVADSSRIEAIERLGAGVVSVGPCVTPEGR
ncbi:tyrosine-type recombinase/integrase [Prescottella agglutinans]|uniref:Integrase/recombinase XerD n=1 Tax=Prescottella agglutinans TaxID=1644129 RepID=A0ABT6ME58_9NOCA|nr:tyrosine-type recombinase/integrase [Prescottella agglutinans]MDH6282593.1 integrase/recombinase XerD [Prescottella agglutinans]